MGSQSIDRSIRLLVVFWMPSVMADVAGWLIKYWGSAEMYELLSLVYASFLLTSLVSFVGVAYFVSQLGVMHKDYVALIYLNMIICIMSGLLHMFYFSQLMPKFGQVGAGELLEIIKNFPIWLRYGYWLITTVMLIVMFPLLVGVERVGNQFLVLLAIADGLMITCGFIGESSMRSAGTVTPVGIVFFLIGISFWMYMIAYIFMVLRRLPSGELLPVQRDTLGYMLFLVMIGWTMYPMGYFQGVVFDDAIGIVLREFTFNLGDIVNKVIWGIMVVVAAVAVSREIRKKSDASAR